MEKYQAFIEAWGVAHWEFTLAFEDLADEDLWRRPHPSLLSVGELAAHVAYSESQLPQPMTQSPLVDKRSRYYLHQVDDPLVLNLTVAQVLEELMTVHDAAVAAASQVQNVDEIVQRANKTNFGLAAAVWSRDIAKAHKLAAGIRAGTVWINCYDVFDAGAPFGGFKESGLGRELGEAGLQAYTETKTVTVSLT